MRLKGKRYVVSVLVETEIEPLPACDSKVGMDLGVKDFATYPPVKSFPTPSI